MPVRETYRLAPPVALWWVWLAFVAANVADWAVQGTSAGLALTVGAIMLAVTGAVYALALRPRVVADEEGIAVLNPFRDHRVPWTAVRDVDTAEWVLVRAAGSAGDKTICCWALYVSTRSRRAANAPPRKSLAMSRLRGVATEPGTGISPRLPEQAQYLASLPPARAIAARLGSRAEKARARDGSAGAMVTASWAWFSIAAVVVPAVALVIVLLVV
jgi:Bacterial PH domain